MCRHLVFLLLGVSWVTAGAAAAERAAPDKAVAEKATVERLARLVSDLGSDDFDVRESAARQLEALGPPALPVLTRALTSTDAEVRRRAAEIAGRLARRQETAEVLQTRPFRIVCRDLAVATAVQEFARVSGCRIALDSTASAKLANQKVTVDTDLTTFWEALDRFCQAAGLTEKLNATMRDLNDPYGYQEQMFWRGGFGRRWPNRREGAMPAFVNGQLVLTDGTRSALPAFRAGALRVRALPPDTPLGNWPLMKGDGEALVVLEIATDPALGWQSAESVRIERAVDDRGQRLAQPQAYLNMPHIPQEWDDWMVYYPGPAYEAQGLGGQRVALLLRRGTKASAKLKELRGVVTVQVQPPAQPVATMDNILKAAGKSVVGLDGWQLRVPEVSRDENGAVTLRVQIEPPPEEGQNRFNPWGGMRRLRWRGIGMWDAEGNPTPPTNLTLLDENGHLVRLVRHEFTDDGTGGPEEYRLTFQPARGQADPARLVLHGRRNVTLDVPFTLTEVSLR